MLPSCRKERPKLSSVVDCFEIDPVFQAASKEGETKDASRVKKPWSRRERQCLELAAQGKSDWVSSRIIGLSERRVHNHVENAKRRLQVATRVQAIVHALAGQQISLGDVVCCDSRPSVTLDVVRLPGVPVKSRTKTANY